jgi:hypothetical protein
LRVTFEHAYVRIVPAGRGCVLTRLSQNRGYPTNPFAAPLAYLRTWWTSGSAVERERTARTKAMRDDGTGYFMIQSTRPQTLGYALADSPVGLLAWVFEKLVDWTDAYPWEDDEGGRVFATYSAEADAQAMGPRSA